MLAQWLERRGCNVVIVRPDHYVYGGAVTVAWAMELLEGMELALWCKRPDRRHRVMAALATRRSGLRKG